MRIKDLLITIFILVPVLSFAQATDEGIHLIDSLESAAMKMPDTKSTKGALLGDIGMVYRQKGSNPKAIEYYQKALTIFEAQGNKNGISRISGDIGSIYLGMVLNANGAEKLSPEAETENLHKAVNYLDRSVSLANENGYADVMTTFYKDLSVALKMLNSKAPVAADTTQNNGDNKQATDDGASVKIANAGIQGAEDASNKQLNKEIVSDDKERWVYIGGISLLVIVLVILTLTMRSTYNKQKTINSIVSKEKKKAEDLLLNILPAQAAAELQDKGMVHPQQFDNVTVLITDFVGFTTAAERFSAKQLVGELHTCFKAFDGMLDKYKVEKIKTIGDAYLAVAGVPVSDANHAVNALTVAINMRDFMLYRKTQLGEATFEMRIGLHTGSVVAGIVGTKKFAYDIWGDTVNLAARMEQNSVSGKINISQSTYDLVKDKFHCEYRGEIEAKNKGKVKMYYVLDKL